MYFSRFKKYKESFKAIVLVVVFITVLFLDLSYSNLYILDSTIKIPVLLLGLVFAFMLFKLLYKYFFSSLRTNNFNYDL